MNTKRKGIIFVISAPSGSGKTSIANYLLKDRHLNLVKSISLTTRPCRPQEKGGYEYHFITKKDFLKRLRKKYFLEYAHVFSNLYGTPKKPVLDAINKGKDVLLSIDVQGAMQIKKQYRKRTLFIFIMPPSMDELKKRLHGRRTEGRHEITKRLKVAKKEMSYITKYDYLIINDSLKKAVDRIKAVIIANRCKVGDTF